MSIPIEYLGTNQRELQIAIDELDALSQIYDRLYHTGINLDSLYDSMKNIETRIEYYTNLMKK